jgi:hypothetical protein
VQDTSCRENREFSFPYTSTVDEGVQRVFPLPGS